MKQIKFNLKYILRCSYNKPKLKNIIINLFKNMTLLQRYIQTALRKAKYNYDEETKSFIAVVEELPLCWGQGETHEEAREELENVIEGWILLSIQKGEKLPAINEVVIDIPYKQKEFEYV
jgi:predicted RNase H-like HicB family nuclease